MLKLSCLHKAYRPNLLQSLTLDYTQSFSRFVSSTQSSQHSTLYSNSANTTTGNILVGSTGLIQSTKQQQPQSKLSIINKRHQYYSTLLDIGYETEQLLGNERFSMQSGMTHNFGNFSDIIILFSFKVAHIDHPILHLIKILEAEFSNKAKYDEQNSTSAWKTNPYPLWRSMMIQLATEMFGYKSENFPKQEDTLEEPQKLLTERQVRMSKIIEIAYITEEIHKRILDVEEIHNPKSNLNVNNTSPTLSKLDKKNYIDNLHRANKAATLIGDLLWTQKMVQLGALKCQLVTGLICKFLMEYCESEFYFGINSSKPEQFNYNSWLEKTRLSIGSLMGNTLSSMLFFSGHDDIMRNKAYKLGSLLGMTYQAYNDLRYFERDELKEPNWLDLGMLPVVSKIEENPNLLNYSYAEIFNTVKEDNENMEKAVEKFQILKLGTLDYINSLSSCCESSSAKNLLTKYIQTLQL